MIDLLIQTDPRYAGIRQRARRRRTRLFARVLRRAMRGSVRGLRRLVAWQRRRRLIAELRSLDDLLLVDIGLCRGDILPTVDELMRRHRHAVEQSAARHGALAPAPRFEPASRPVIVAPAIVAPASPAAQNDNAARRPPAPAPVSCSSRSR